MTVGISCVRYLTVTMFALKLSAWIDELFLLVAQGSMKTLLAFTAVRLRVHWNTSPMDTPTNGGIRALLVVPRSALHISLLEFD